MKILVLADQECPALWDYFRPERLDGIDLILSCGDLKADYLTFLATMARVPLFYVRGNHDDRYETRPPEGCECIENQLITCKGVRILGMGGSPLYSGGNNQYTERQMAWRMHRAGWQIRKAGGVDILVAHAAPRGYGDAEDYAHRGFEVFLPFLDRYRPRYLVHGHIHMNYGVDIPRTLIYGNTTIVNAWERYVLDF